MGAQRRQLVNSEVREGFLEEGVSAPRCEERVHLSLLREQERNSRKESLPVPRPEIGTSLAGVQGKMGHCPERLVGSRGPWILCRWLTG